jgi:hypothetical protein
MKRPELDFRSIEALRVLRIVIGIHIRCFQKNIQKCGDSKAINKLIKIQFSKSLMKDSLLMELSLT